MEALTRVQSRDVALKGYTIAQSKQGRSHLILLQRPIPICIKKTKGSLDLKILQTPAHSRAETQNHLSPTSHLRILILLAFHLYPSQFLASTFMKHPWDVTGNQSPEEYSASAWIRTNWRDITKQYMPSVQVPHLWMISSRQQFRVPIAAD